MGQRFLHYRDLKADIRMMRTQNKVLQNLYMPPLEQIKELNENHEKTMNIVEEKFRECQDIQERIKKLNKRV